ncbi:ryncolin-1-like [Watersipora subatra]|uniref:ryncolin-1-like n=1 Tax=Watersipora subatra TaxID=2589382 RepID=UPI00355C8543
MRFDLMPKYPQVVAHESFILTHASFFKDIWVIEFTPQLFECSQEYKTDQEQELFVYRQQVLVIHRFLQNECPDLVRSKRQVSDDTAMSLEVMKTVYDNLMETLKKCRLRESQKSTEKTPTTLSSSVPKDCQQLYESGERVSGVYSIDPFPEKMQPFSVWCDFFDGHGWTVFQKRLDGSLDFYRNWAEYQSGFGNAAKEYWLGLDKIYALTKSNQLLNIYVKASNGATRSGTWQTFFIRNETDNYTLTVNDAGYNGTLLSYSFFHHNGMPFSTRDKDNDIDARNCAVEYHGGWWYTDCYRSNLNGEYGKNDDQGIRWVGLSDELMETVMRISRN